MSPEQPVPPAEPAPTAVSADAPRIPDYDLLRLIGRGSYGDVWLARGVTGIFRAVKLVWRERFADAEPFEREFRGLKEFAAISQSEPALLALLHVGRNEASGFFYYVMELADDTDHGPTIDPESYVALTLAETRRRGRLPAEECVRLGVDLARSLAGLHRRGLVHRDIKPSNVIFVGGVPKLADIGLVVPAASAQTFVGTEGYVPPEGPGSPGADVYALGKVLYELATGLDRQLFPQLPPELHALPDWRALLQLNQIIMRACEPQPEKRYTDATALLADLQTLHGGRPVRRFAHWHVAAAATAFVAVGAVGVALWWKPRPVPPAVAAEALSLAEAPGNSIAVLPFTNMSDDKENAYFTDGVYEDVVTNLANLRALRVISRTSMLQYRETTKPIGQIGRELGVAYILEGSVRRASNRVRVSGQLIKAATEEHVWAKTYDRELQDIFAVQADLAREITTALRLALSPTENNRLDLVPTSNSAAYDLLKQAKSIEARGWNTRDQRELVLPLLERAVELDPNYAEAWAMLSNIHLDFYAVVARTDERLNLARLALARADLLAPDAYYTLRAGANLGAVTRDRDVVNARRRRIIELFPGRAEAHLALAATAFFEHRWADALAGSRAAAQLDPRNSSVLETHFDTLRLARRYDEAESVGRLLLEIQPENLPIRMGVAEIPFLRSGSAEQVERLIQELPASTVNDPNVISVRARTALIMGRHREVVDLWHSTGERFRFGPEAEGSADLNLMIVAGSMMALGDAASARPLLEKLRDSTLRQLESEPGNARGVSGLGIIQAMLGDRDGGTATLARARELIRENPDAPGATLARWENAGYRTWVGEGTEAIAEFARLLRDPTERPPWGYVHKMRRLWLFHPLRDDPEFEQLLNDPANNAPLF